MKKNITESAPDVNAEQPAANNDELIAQMEVQTVQITEAETVVTSQNVIKTRH
jgi:hypothetical protein